MFEELNKKLKKIPKRQTLEINKMKGKIAEQSYEISAAVKGKKVTRTGKGHDYLEEDIDFWTGKIKKKTYVEVKSSQTARLSKLQKKTKKKKRNYKVERPKTFSKTFTW